MDQSAFAHMEKMLRDETKGEYVVGKMLGRGGMAVVYLAEETRLGRKVALKVLPPELTFGHGVDRFLREAKTAATLDHPNIIPIYRIASGGKLFWYAMKYLEGKSLEDVLREQGTLHIPDAREQNDIPLVRKFRTFLAVPLRQQGQLIGGLFARRTEVLQSINLSAVIERRVLFGEVLLHFRARDARDTFDGRQR